MKKLLVLISIIFSLIISPTHTFAEDASQPYVTRGEYSEKLASVLKEKGLLGKSQNYQSLKVMGTEYSDQTIIFYIRKRQQWSPELLQQKIS